MKSFFTRLLCIAAASASLYTLSGCAAVFHSMNSALVTQQDSTQLKLDEGGGSIWSGSGYDLSPIEMHGKIAKVKLDNRNEYYLVEQRRKGYLSSTTMLSRNKFNTTKLIDIAIPFLSDMYLLSGAGVTTDPATGQTTSGGGQVVAWVLGTVGWIDIGFGPWKKFDKIYNLPALIPLPLKKNTQNRIYVKDAGVDIKKDSMIRTYYSTYKDYLTHSLLYTSSEKEAFKYRNTEFKDSLNRILAKWGYVDTSKALLSNMYNGAYYLKCNMYNMSINTVNSLTFFTVKSTWQIFGATTDKPLYEANLESASRWGGFQESEDEFGGYIADAMERQMAEFLNREKVQACLNEVNSVKNAEEHWEQINFAAPSPSANLQDAIKSVVTVKVPDGHGSGCIVSSDGYIVTNYHVISEDTSNTVKVILASGDTLDASYIRSNSAYDLALLKINKPGNYSYFSASLSKDIMVGSEVYAIGTPEDISLGQTITKGIISGKRKVNDKVVIQTDVSINPGNSGGALVTKDGVLQGIVTAKLMGEVQGIGFVIPAYYIEDALKVKFSSK